VSREQATHPGTEAHRFTSIWQKLQMSPHSPGVVPDAAAVDGRVRALAIGRIAEVVGARVAVVLTLDRRAGHALARDALAGIAEIAAAHPGQGLLRRTLVGGARPVAGTGVQIVAVGVGGATGFGCAAALVIVARGAHA
jgi:hypothetical protein